MSEETTDDIKIDGVPVAPRFLFLKASTWFGIAKFVSIAGAGLAAILAAAGSFYKAIWGD